MILFTFVYIFQKPTSILKKIPSNHGGFPCPLFDQFLLGHLAKALVLPPVLLLAALVTVESLRYFEESLDL